MFAGVLRWCGLVTATLLVLSGTRSVAAADEPLEVVEVRADGFPRMVVRLNVLSEERPSAVKLGPEHLRVVEDGKAQPSADLYEIRNPVLAASVVLAMDVSGSMAEQNRLPQARDAAKGFLGQMRPRDQAALVSFADEVSLRQAFTADRRLLGRAIDGLAAAGDTRLYDALTRGVTQVSSAPSGTRALIVLTDGQDTASKSDVVEGIALATRAGIPVYTIGLGSEVQADVLQKIAADTGGRFYHAPAGQDLAQIFRRISRQLSTQYELSWVSRAQGEAGREVPVQVTLNAPGWPSGDITFNYRLPRSTQAATTYLSTVSPEPLPEISRSMVPSQDLVLVAGLLAGTCVALLYSGLLVRATHRRLHTRLATYLAGGGGPALAPNGGASVSLRQSPLRPVTSTIAQIAKFLLPRGHVAHTRRDLMKAGFPLERHLDAFLTAKVCMALLIGGATYALLQMNGAGRRGPIQAAVMVVALAILGFYLPRLWLGWRIRKRQKALRRALPDALDLMAIGVSAGLALDGAMLEVVQKWDTVLSREFNQVLNEIRMGTGRREALLNLTERTQLEDIRLLVASLIQADELGTSLAESLSIQAEQLRIRRRQHAEEQARKAPVKMLIPLVFLIFPAMFVVILGPAVLQVLRSLQGITGGY